MLANLKRGLAPQISSATGLAMTMMAPDSRIKVERTSSATSLAGGLVEVPPHNPRFETDAATGLPKGLLLEEARANAFPNGSCSGAVVGGVLPSRWSVFSSAGLTTEVVGTGLQAGLPYVDIRIYGTTNLTQYLLEFTDNTSVPVLPSQTWTFSATIARIAGSDTPISAYQVRFSERQANGSSIAAPTVNFTMPTGTPQRVSVTRTLGTNVAIERLTAGLRLAFPPGVAMDVTYRIAALQLEQGAFATSWIPTTNGSVQRSAERAFLAAGSVRINPACGTFLVEATPMALLPGQGLLSLWNGMNIASGGLILRADTTTLSRLVLEQVSGGGAVTTTIINTGSMSPQTRLRVACCYNRSTVSVSVNGQAVTTVSAAFLLPNSRVQLGGTPAGASWNGHVHKFTYRPDRIPDSQLSLWQG